MRRDYFDAHVRDGDDEGDRPVVEISFDGPDGLLAERLTTDDGTLEANEIDVTYRLTEGEADGSGVLSVANRLTGEFVLETNLESESVSELVRTVKEWDGDEKTSYRLRLVASDGKSTVYDKETFLVYDADGSLLRKRSLIPGGVEL